jgi:hypothetical protein
VDAVLGVLQRGGPREVQHRALGEGVGIRPREPDAAEDAAQVDDPASVDVLRGARGSPAVQRMGFLGEELRTCVFRAEPDALDVDLVGEVED